MSSSSDTVGIFDKGALATALAAGVWQIFDQTLPGAVPISIQDIILRVIIVVVITYAVYMITKGLGV